MTICVYKTIRLLFKILIHGYLLILESKDGGWGERNIS